MKSYQLKCHVVLAKDNSHNKQALLVPGTATLESDTGSITVRFSLSGVGLKKDISAHAVSPVKRSGVQSTT